MFPRCFLLLLCAHRIINSILSLHSQPLTNLLGHSQLCAPHLFGIAAADRAQILAMCVSLEDDHGRVSINISLHSHWTPRIKFAMREENIGHVWSEAIVIAVRLVDIALDEEGGVSGIDRTYLRSYTNSISKLPPRSTH